MILNLPATAATAAPARPNALEYLPAGSTWVGGALGQQIRLCVDHRILAQNVPALIKPFVDRKDVTEWRGEFWGKWLTSAVAAYRVAPSPALRAKIERALAALAATRTPDGYIGTYAPEHRLQRWDVWSRKYTMLGLLACHEVTGDEAALASARGVADGILREAAAAPETFFQHDMWSGMATSSVLEPIALLYRVTGDQRYLDFCRWIVEAWSRPAGPNLLRQALDGVPVAAMFPGPDPQQAGYFSAGSSKAYEMMSCYEGLVELHRATGEPLYADAAKAVHRSIRETEITLIGSGSDWERWCDGRRRQPGAWQKGMETCVTVTWLKFSAQLLRLTGDAGYADDIELAAYNALLGAQSPDGSWWAHHCPLAGVKERAPEQCDLPQNCCVANGPRGLMLLPELAVLMGRDGPVINLYGEMKTSLKLANGRRVRIQQLSRYPADNAVRIELTPDAPGRFVLALRIPGWSRATRVTVNGSALPGVEAGRYLPIDRTWKPGDVVSLTLDFRPVVHEAPGQPGYFALTRGPLVLARDTRLSEDVDTPVAFDFATREAIELVPLRSPPSLAGGLSFEARDRAGHRLRLCDYASAGNTWTDSSRFRVWSKPTADLPANIE